MAPRLGRQPGTDGDLLVLSADGKGIVMRPDVEGDDVRRHPGGTGVEHRSSVGLGVLDDGATKPSHLT